MKMGPLTLGRRMEVDTCSDTLADEQVCAGGASWKCRSGITHNLHYIHFLSVKSLNLKRNIGNRIHFVRNWNYASCFSRR